MDRELTVGGATTPYTTFQNANSNTNSNGNPGGPIPLTSSRTTSSQLSQAYNNVQAQRSRSSLTSREHFTDGNSSDSDKHATATYYYDEVRNPVHGHTPATDAASTTLGRQSSSSSRQPSSQPAPYQSIDTTSSAAAYPATKSVASGEHPLLEIPEEIYSVRKAALHVLRPLTKTWLIVSVGFALTVLFGMARWTQLLMNLPFWFILLPSWLSHVGLFWCHVMSAKALSMFITEANDSRQRPDSRDHLDRTEYLPLLQRSLKFGLKTGLVSFGVFIFEILVYLRLAHGTTSFTVIFIPLWILVTGSILDGIICKTQHFIRVICWLLIFASMILAVLKTDYEYDQIRWRYIVSPVVAVLSICSICLIYIVYGHQIGYYRLTESQLTAGNLYSLAALISIVLVIVVGEVIPLARPVEIETRIFVVVMAPLVMVLVGMGAWVVSRDEYGRLLIYGGQTAVHPRKLRWENNSGWTTVQGRGVTNIPMFGEVRFQPLESKPPSGLESCLCCFSCYPHEVNSVDNPTIQDDPLVSHPYLAPNTSATVSPLSYTSPPEQQASYQHQGGV